MRGVECAQGKEQGEQQGRRWQQPWREQGSRGTIPGEPKAERLGTRGGCKKEKEPSQEGRTWEGYKVRPDKDSLAEGKGNG